MLHNRYKYNKKSIEKLNKLQIRTKEVVEKKVEDGIYAFEKISCPICNKNNFDLLAEKDRYGLKCYTVLCEDCGLLLTNPRMNQNAYNEFYDKEYRNLYTASEVSTDDFFSEQWRHGKAILQYILQYSDIRSFKRKTVLEVGCGAGGILKAFKDEGAEIIGLDLGSNYLKYGIEQYNLSLVHGSIHSHSFDKKIDIIIYSHVLEHILDLDAEIMKIKELCGEQTLIYIELPGLLNIKKAYNGDFLGYLQNAHVFHFSLKSLENLFLKYGFGLIDGNETIQSLFRLDPAVLADTRNLYHDHIRYLKQVESRKWYYQLKDQVYRILKKVYRSFITRKTSK